MAEILQIIEITAGDEIIEVGDIILTAGYDVTDAVLVNVTNYVPLGAGEYYTLTTAIAAVPGDMRKTGLCITFATSSGVWKSYQFKGSSIADWATEDNWELQGVSQAAVDGKEPLLPGTPDNPDIKYLNGLREWAPLAPTHDQTLDKNGNADYLHVTKAAQTFEGVKTFTDGLIVPNLTSGSADGSVVNKKTMVDADALKIDKASIANNLTTTAEGYTLDARQGKTLNDAIALKENAANKKTIINDSDTEFPTSKAVRTEFIRTNRTLAEVLSTLDARILSLETFIKGNLGDVTVNTINIIKGVNQYGSDGNAELKASGAPAAIPDYIGQQYTDTANGNIYKAKNNTAIADWVKIN